MSEGTNEVYTNEVNGSTNGSASPNLEAQIDAWNELLAGEGLGVVTPEEPIAEPEFEHVFDIASIAGEADVEPIEAVIDIASHDDPADIQGPSSPVLTERDFEYLSRVRDLGGAATFDEVSATPESLAKLTDAGLLTGRVAEQGVAVLALTGATDRDVWVAANRQVSDNCAEHFIWDIVECEKIAQRILARVEKLGGTCDKAALVDSLGGHPREAVEAVIAELTRRGLVKRAVHAISGYTLLASTVEPVYATSAAFANTLRGLLKLDADSARNRRFSWKEFAEEASGRRPDDDEVQDRFAFEKAANEFRAAGRKATQGVKLSPFQIARKMLTNLEAGLDTFRNLAGGRREDVAVKAAIIAKLEGKGLIVKTGYKNQLAYKLAEAAVPAPTKGGTLPRSAARKAHGRAVRIERTRQAFREAIRDTDPEKVAIATARAAFLAEATVGEKIVIRLLKEGTVPQNALCSEDNGLSKEETEELLQTMGETGLIKRSKGCLSGDLYISLAGTWEEKSARHILGMRLLKIIGDSDSGIDVPEGTRLAVKVAALRTEQSEQEEAAKALASVQTPGLELAA